RGSGELPGRPHPELRLLADRARGPPGRRPRPGRPRRRAGWHRARDGGAGRRLRLRRAGAAVPPRAQRWISSGAQRHPLPAGIRDPVGPRAGRRGCGPLRGRRRDRHATGGRLVRPGHRPGVGVPLRPAGGVLPRGLARAETGRRASDRRRGAASAGLRPAAQGAGRFALALPGGQRLRRGGLRRSADAGRLRLDRTAADPREGLSAVRTLDAGPGPAAAPATIARLAAARGRARADPPAPPSPPARAARLHPGTCGEGGGVMVAFVTGATGCIGRRLTAALLAEGYEVTALVRPDRDRPRGLPESVRRVYGDTRDPAALRQADGCDILFHLAGVYRLGETDPRTME